MSELKSIQLRDYTPPAFLVEQVELRVELAPRATLVHSRLQLRANPAAGVPATTLRLDGRQLELLHLAVDGVTLGPAQYQLDAEGLSIPGVAERLLLESTVRIDPEGNTALEGLYRASGIFCTQCEAQGFRKITFFPDRPDVMTRFTTTVVGELALCPVLLANGNLAASGGLDAGRHFATFVDPFPKPSYLFALVAGPLVASEDRYTTASGRTVNLQIFVEARNRARCAHAMASLKNAMRWDEETYGLECDLDEYKIVAVEAAAGGEVAVGQQNRAERASADHGGGKTGHDVGAVGVEGDLAEPLRLTLGAEDAAGPVEPLQRRVSLRIDAHRRLQYAALRHAGDGQPLGIDSIGGRREGRPVECDFKQFQLAAVETQDPGRGPGGRIGGELQAGAHPGGPGVELDMQLNLLDQVGGRRVILQVNRLQLTHQITLALLFTFYLSRLLATGQNTAIYRGWQTPMTGGSA